MSYTTFLWSLFCSAFVSSTLLPGGSEALVVYGMTEYSDKLFSLVLTATIGNTLGAIVTYGIGRLIPNKKQDERSLGLFKKWGPITLLFSWVPIVGDGFCLAAGWLRLNFCLSVVLILIGKAARYWVLAAVTLGILG